MSGFTDKFYPLREGLWESRHVPEDQVLFLEPGLLPVLPPMPEVEVSERLIMGKFLADYFQLPVILAQQEAT